MLKATHNKVPVIPRNSQQKKFHTLHLVENIFTIQKNGTAIVSFRNKYDAFHLGKMLECHFEMTHEWPVINFEDSILYKPNSKIHRLKYIEMRSWDEESIKNFCIKNNFSMLDIFTFETDHRLVGKSIFWEAPPDYYISHLNTMFDES